MKKIWFWWHKIEYFYRYVIKATTYEIGILADVPNDDNTTADGPVTHQQVDLTFYNTESNDSFINFGTVPLPIQTTGVKGQVITGKWTSFLLLNFGYWREIFFPKLGIAPVNIGAVDDVGDVLKALPFSGTIVNITQADTSFIHISRENLTEHEHEIKLNDSNTDLAQLPILNTVLLPDNFNEAYDTVHSESQSEWL